jgi:hypothetical protein
MGYKGTAATTPNLFWKEYKLSVRHGLKQYMISYPREKKVLGVLVLRRSSSSRRKKFIYLLRSLDTRKQEITWKVANISV